MAPAGKAGDKAPEAPEELPIIKQLKEIDDQYLALEREYQEECQKLQLQFAEKQKPLLQERRKMLSSAEGEVTSSKSGTPALSSFWLTAMLNHPAVGDGIQEWDEPVLEYLADIEKADVDDADSSKGFKLVFHFVENQYFSNRELWKEYTTELANPYCGELEVKEVKCSKIEWKLGKDVTVQSVARKMKGGAKKASKHKREKEEPRPSFFRDFFRNLHKEMKLEEDAREQALSLADDDEEDDDDDEHLLMYLMESDHEIGMAVRNSIVPFAVRWYTGEASPDLDDDDEDDEDEEEEEDLVEGEEEEEMDEEEEETEEKEEPPSKSKAKSKPNWKSSKGGRGGSEKSFFENKTGDAGKEECKQQ